MRTSKTIMPNKWVDSNGFVYWDCPGFKDTQGFEQDVENGLYINEIFKKSKKIKTIVVVSESMIKGRANQFIGILNDIENLFN
jgi:hypothetical protein